MPQFDNTLPTKDLQAIDAAHHMHPFTDAGALAKQGARIIKSANGPYLWDNDGVKILDGMSGLWCVNIGYGRDELAEASARQMIQLPYYNTFFHTTHPPVIALSQKIAELAPKHMNHVFFSSSGSEANDTNIRLVRHYWASLDQPKKNIIIARKNGYHGSTVAGASLGGMTAMHEQGDLPIPDIHHIDQPYWYGEGRDMDPEEFGLLRARALETEINRLGVDRVAAFIAEPIQGAGGVIIPPKSYWPEIQRICKEYDILLIVDEVITGFGRTGEWFACDYFDIKPDIITIAKGLSSGYASIGGTIFSDRIAEVLYSQKAGEFAHGYTYSGHPVSCAVALENLRILEDEKIVKHVRDTAAPYLAEKWQQLGDHPLAGEARSCGMVAAIELTSDKSTLAPFSTPVGTVGLMGRDICFENGLIMRNVRDSLIIAPPLIVTTEHIDELTDKAWRALDTLETKLKEEGII